MVGIAVRAAAGRVAVRRVRAAAARRAEGGSFSCAFYVPILISYFICANSIYKYAKLELAHKKRRYKYKMLQRST